MLAIELRRTGDLGDVSLGRLVLIQIQIRCVRAGPVVFEVSNELAMDTDRTGHDGHDVLSERSSLVGADNRGVCHCLAGAEDTDEELLGGHPLRSESEREGYRKREAFRNSDNNKGDRDDQNLGEGDALLIGSTTRTP